MSAGSAIAAGRPEASVFTESARCRSRLVDPQGRFWDEERVETRGLHVVQALKKHLPSDVERRRPPWRVHIADGQFMRCCADVRRHDRRQQYKCADLVRRRVELCSETAHGMADEDRWRIEAACD